MTNDEFERIIVAIMQMKIQNINGTSLVSLEGVTRIIHSNLHVEDKQGWEWFADKDKIGWRKVGEKQ